MSKLEDVSKAKSALLKSRNGISVREENGVGKMLFAIL